jgi:alcohol dehydrogenase class IV
MWPRLSKRGDLRSQTAVLDGYESEMHFEFATATRIVFGAAALDRAGKNLKIHGRRALVVTGRNLSRAGKLLADLQANDVSSVTFAVPGEPELATVGLGTRLAKTEQCDFVIGFGGGSALDAAKSIAAMLKNDGELLDYVEIIGRGRPLKKRPAPFIAIPTTAGTGSEVTRNAVLSSPEHKVKVSLRSPLLLARVAMIDPELTYDLPPALTASTGLDALTQLIEPFVCSRANPITDGLCVDGIQRVARSLREAVHNGQNKSAREDMAMASLFGGLALANAGLGAVHGFAGPIGGMFPAPHGAVCAALLPHVMATNIRALCERDERSRALSRYDRIAQICTDNQHATADAGVEWVRQLVADLLIPPLRAYGVEAGHIADIAAKAANANSMKANPIVLTSGELKETLQRAL